jgi:hypothetical protein
MGDRMKGGAVKDERSPENDAILEDFRQCQSPNKVIQLVVELKERTI